MVILEFKSGKIVNYKKASEFFVGHSWVTIKGKVAVTSRTPIYHPMTGRFMRRVKKTSMETRQLAAVNTRDVLRIEYGGASAVVKAGKQPKKKQKK
jgi:hypothetical protein